MTGGQDNRTAIALLGASGHIDGFHANDARLLVDVEGRHLGLEMHLTTTPLYLKPHVLNDARQLVGADMGMDIGQDRCRGAMLTKHVEYLVHVAPLFAAGIEFAVAVGTCPTLAEAIIALRVNLLGLGNERHVALAVAHILSALKDDGTQTELYQAQGGKQSARSLTDNDNLRPPAHVGIVGADEVFILRQFVDIDAHLQVDHHRALSGVNAAAQHAHTAHAVGCESFLLGKISDEVLLRVSHFGQHTYLVFGDHVYKLLFHLQNYRFSFISQGNYANNLHFPWR